MSISFVIRNVNNKIANKKYTTILTYIIIITNAGNKITNKNNVSNMFTTINILYSSSSS